jgi:uncharacterized protein YndB with AHSA1/START domain
VWFVEEVVMTENRVQSKAAMLIRRPVTEVFEAFVNPAITTQFWFTKSSGPLETGNTVKWEWELYNASTDVLVKAIEPNRRLVIEWDGYSGKAIVEWTFTDMGDGTTFVRITESGFSGTPAEIAQQAVDSTGGFTLVVCGLKALLEHNIHLNLVADRFPPGLPEGAG